MRSAAVVGEAIKIDHEKHEKHERGGSTEAPRRRRNPSSTAEGAEERRENAEAFARFLGSAPLCRPRGKSYCGFAA
jgi:hypothetical protein